MKKCIVNFNGKQYIGEIIKEGSNEYRNGILVDIKIIPDYLYKSTIWFSKEEVKLLD